MSKKEIKFTKRPATPTVPTNADAWVNSPVGSDLAVKPNAPALPEETMKRLTIDIPESLHVRVKSQCAKRGEKMADAIRALLESHFPEGQ